MSIPHSIGLASGWMGRGSFGLPVGWRQFVHKRSDLLIVRRDHLLAALLVPDDGDAGAEDEVAVGVVAVVVSVDERSHGAVAGRRPLPV